MESILTSIKKLLGISAEYEHFDADLIMHINSVFMILNQLGVGPPDGFYITNSFATWDEYTEDKRTIEAVKSYVYLKVRLMFDPPQNTGLIQAIDRQIAELEWRLNVAVDPGPS